MKLEEMTKNDIGEFLTTLDATGYSMFVEWAKLPDANEPSAMDAMLTYFGFPKEVKAKIREVLREHLIEACEIEAKDSL